MAPRMGTYQHALVEDLLWLGVTWAECASTAGCTTRSITAIRRNLRIFGSTRAPPNGEGGQFLLSNRMIVVILMRLEEKPTLFSDELQWLIYDIFSVVISSDVNGLDWIQKSLQIQSKNQIRLLNRLRNWLNQIIQIYIQLYRESWLGVRAEVRFMIGKRL